MYCLRSLAVIFTSAKLYGAEFSLLVVRPCTLLRDRSTLFFRMLVAIPFLPLVEINTALEELAIFSFNPVHPSLSKMEDFRDKILEYFTRFGVFNKFNCL